MTTPHVAHVDNLSAKMATEIRGLMGRQNINRSALARRLGVEDSWVGKRLNGFREIGSNDAERIARALGVNVVDLLPRSERRETVTASFPPGHTPIDMASMGVPSYGLPSGTRRTALTGR